MYRQRYVEAACDCGTTKTIRLQHLQSGATKSCGCLSKLHGESAHGIEFRVWAAMIRRCTNPNAKGFERYGGRGIKVCDRWRKSFPSFLSDIGRRPSSSHQLDRIDNDGDYDPGNCRWATRREQNRNKSTNHRLEHGGLNLTIAEWSERTGIKPKTILQRVSVYKWPVSRALNEWGNNDGQ